MRERFEILADLINKNLYKYAAEIGVCAGITAKYLLEHCSQLEKYYLVDPLNTNRFKYEDIMKHHTAPIILQIPSVDAAKVISNHSLDLVYIDADHSYPSVKLDILTWLPKIRMGGIICGHDYNGQPTWGVNKAVNEMFKLERHNRVNLEEDKQNPKVCVWWVKKDWL